MLGHLSSNALSRVESVPWFHGAKRLMSEWRRGRGIKSGKQIHHILPLLLRYGSCSLVGHHASQQNMPFTTYTTGNFPVRVTFGGPKAREVLHKCTCLECFRCTNWNSKRLKKSKKKRYSIECNPQLLRHKRYLLMNSAVLFFRHFAKVLTCRH